MVGFFWGGKLPQMFNLTKVSGCIGGTWIAWRWKWRNLIEEHVIYNYTLILTWNARNDLDQKKGLNGFRFVAKSTMTLTDWVTEFRCFFEIDVFWWLRCLNYRFSLCAIRLFPSVCFLKISTMKIPMANGKPFRCHFCTFTPSDVRSGETRFLRTDQDLATCILNLLQTHQYFI